MSTDSPKRALLVVLAVSLACSVLVSIAAISLRPIQERNQLIERSRHLVALTGLVEQGAILSDDEILAVVQRLDLRVIDLDSGQFDDAIDADSFDARAAANDPQRSTILAPADDLGNIGRRARHAAVYVVWGNDNTLQRVILPIHGQGMWSTLRGLLAVESDLETIGAMTFYEQAETAGLGDQILRPDWQAQWRGRRLFGSQGDVRFRVAGGAVDADSPTSAYEVDGLTGATVTGTAVTNLIRFWFGPNGYGPFLRTMRDTPPSRAQTPAVARDTANQAAGGASPEEQRR